MQADFTGGESKAIATMLAAAENAAGLADKLEAAAEELEAMLRNILAPDAVKTLSAAQKTADGRKAIAGAVTMTGGQITGELTGDEYNRLVIRAQTENKQFGTVLLEHAAETIIRTRLTPRQCSLIVAGAALEDALDLEPGSLLDPDWASFVSATVNGETNVSNLLEGFDMATEPTPDAVARAQGIITAALDRTGTSEGEAAA